MDSLEIIRETITICNARFSDMLLDHANSGNREHREAAQKRSIFDFDLKPSRQPFVRNPASQRAPTLHVPQYDGERQHTRRIPQRVLRDKAAKAESASVAITISPERARHPACLLRPGVDGLRRPQFEDHSTAGETKWLSTKSRAI